MTKTPSCRTQPSTHVPKIADLLAIGDINGDGVVNNADLQALLNLLKSGGGSLAAVPEPSSLALTIFGAIAFLAVALMRANLRRPAAGMR